jgi:hypothetical protein
MLTTRIRKQLEWHFYNREADLAIRDDEIKSVAESGLTVDYSRVGSGGKRGGSPTESKAIKIAALKAGGDWATVVDNTFNAYKFLPEFDAMVALYVENKSFKEIIKNGKNERGLNSSTFWYWRDKWLETALSWAREYKLL